MRERGSIRNRVAAQQLRDFRGLRWGSVTPTDIDCFVEFGGRLFVFVEGKHGKALLPYGQRLALERLIDACHLPPIRWSFGLVVFHNSEIGEDIDFANSEVSHYRYSGKWMTPTKPINCRAAIDRCIEYINKPALRVIT